VVARSAAIRSLQRELRKVVRRATSAFLNINLSDPNQIRLLCQFLSEDCDLIVSQVSTMVAEASLSCFTSASTREQFLRRFGYNIPIPPSLPYLPLVCVFGADLALLFLPLILSIWVDLGPQKIVPVNVAAISLAHAISYTCAIFLAV